MPTPLPAAGDPDRHLRYLNGLICLRAGQPDLASGHLLQAVRDRPDDVDVRRHLLHALLAAGRHAEVLDQAAIALAIAPDDAQVYFAQGTALNVLRRPAAARAALTRAVVLHPGLAAGWLNLGNACLDLDELPEAERHYRTAIRLDPLLAAAYASLGHLLMTLGRLTEAIEASEAAVRLSPAMAEAHWNLAAALLLRGDLARGMREYEWRKRHPAFRADFPPLPGPYWNGGDPAGKVILVRAEQEFGDTIQFARFLTLIADRGGTPVLRCDPALVPLLTTMPGVALVGRSVNVEGYDAWIDQMSLPLVFGTEQSSVPFAAGYLQAVPSRVAAWRARAGAGPRIGIAWAGNPAQANDRRRFIPPAVLAPLLALPGISFVNLQVGEPAGLMGLGQMAAKPAGLPDLSPALPDFAETAALIATLDLVITVDSAVAHLAGALGAPAWVLLAHVPDWRWSLHGESSPWYRSVRLFRQTAPGDWGGVIERVIAALGIRLMCADGQNRSSP